MKESPIPDQKTARRVDPAPLPAPAGILQRRCACGSGAPGPNGECAECRREHGLQTKLAIGAAGDRHEREADRVADEAMRMTDPGVQRKPRAVTPRSQGPGAGAGAAPPVVDEVLSSPGAPLAPAARAFFEARLGHDFTQVRVHTDARAAESARAVDALAYTVGMHTVFASGQFAPHTGPGRRLIAHELTHTIQQTPNLRAARSHGPLLQRQDGSGSSSGSATATVFMCSKSLDTSPAGSHAFFRIGGSGKGNPTISLQPIDASLGANCWQGVADRDYPSDVDADASCDATSIAVADLEREFAAYPRGHYCTWGPNSNTFVGHVAKNCGISSPDPPGWTPGIDASPPPSGTFAPDKWTTLAGCETKICIIGPDSSDRPADTEIG